MKDPDRLSITPALPAGPEAAAYSADALLRDGTSVHLRAIRPDDKERLRGHFHRLGRESVHHRFRGMKSGLSDRDLRDLTELDFERHVGLVALRRASAEELFLGVGRYIRCGGELPERQRAELFLAVADTEQGLGLGALLLEHLARLAARDGIVELVANVLQDNHRMVEMLKHSGRGSRPGRMGADPAVPSPAILPAALVSRAQASRTKVHRRTLVCSCGNRQALGPPPQLSAVAARLGSTPAALGSPRHPRLVLVQVWSRDRGLDLRGRERARLLARGRPSARAPSPAILVEITVAGRKGRCPYRSPGFLR